MQSEPELNGKLQPAKWYKVVISGIDEFLVEIHANVIALAQNEQFFRIDAKVILYVVLNPHYKLEAY
uniref:Uncharacterized protein n=2 Tax=Rhizophagus irregularis TaxID=588596 RepID=U9T966_RHIID